MGTNERDIEAAPVTPHRRMGPWIFKTPTLLTSDATLLTPASMVDEVFTFNQASQKWANGSGTEVTHPGPLPVSGRSIVHALGGGGAPELMFWGTGAANDAFTAIVIYSRLLIDPARPLVAQLVRRAATSALTCTLGSRAGVSGGLITDLMLYVDTISNAAERGLEPLGTRVNGPTAADNGVVSLVCPDPLMDQWIEVSIKKGSSVTGVGIAISENSGG
jgi:hypothetical protein